MNKFLDFKRSHIVKWYMYVRELHKTMWKNRIRSASFYTAKPVCAQCNGEVVRLKHKVKVGKDFFKVICLTCDYTWYSKRELREPEIDEEIQNYAEYKGLGVEDALHILKMKARAFNKVKENRAKEEKRDEITSDSLRNQGVAWMLLKQAGLH